MVKETAGRESPLTIIYFEDYITHAAILLSSIIYFKHN